MSILSKFKYGLQSVLNISPVKNGEIKVTTDTKNLFIDIDNKRIQISDFVTVVDESALNNIIAPIANKFYYVESNNTIYKYINSNWESITSSIDILDENGRVPIEYGGTGVGTVADIKNVLSINSVDNTNDLAKPISTATQAALDDISDILLTTYNDPETVPTSPVTIDADTLEGHDSNFFLTADALGNKLSEQYNSLVTYTDTAIANLINGAPTTLDTLKEISDAMVESQEVVQLLNDAIGTKVNTTEFTSHTSNVSNPHSVTKDQVGLGNCDNTSDLNKPISTAMKIYNYSTITPNYSSINSGYSAGGMCFRCGNIVILKFHFAVAYFTSGMTLGTVPNGFCPPVTRSGLFVGGRNTSGVSGQDDVIQPGGVSVGVLGNIYQTFNSDGAANTWHGEIFFMYNVN